MTAACRGLYSLSAGGGLHFVTGRGEGVFEMNRPCTTDYAGAAAALPFLALAGSPATAPEYPLWIDAAALLGALAFCRLSYWPAFTAVFVPYFRHGDCEQAGFVSMRALLARIPWYRITAYKLIMPLFATTVLFLVMLLNYLAKRPALMQAPDLYGFALIWGLILLTAGAPFRTLLFLGIPFGIGWLVSRSLYGGYIGSAIVLAIGFAVSSRDNLLLSLVTRKVELETGRSLDGAPLTGLGRLIRRLRIPLWLLELGGIGFTLYSFAENSVFSLSDLALRYAPPQAAGLAATLVMLVLFSNVSLRVFGGLFDYLQLDLFEMLGSSMRMKHERPQEYADMHGSASGDTGQTPDPLPGGVPGVRSTDRLYELKEVGPQFRNALYYFSLDLLLTAATILKIPLLPGLSMEQTGTLSTILKIPVMVVLGIGIPYGISIYLGATRGLDLASDTYRDQIAVAELRFHDTEHLLRGIQQQRTEASGYLDVRANRFLLDLAGKG